MPISSKLARLVNDTLQEAMGALDLALMTDDAQIKNRRITQSKNAMRKAAKLIADHTYTSDIP